MLKGLLIEKNKASIVVFTNEKIIKIVDIMDYEPLIEDDENEQELKNFEIIKQILGERNICFSKRTISNPLDLPMGVRVFHKDIVHNASFYSCINNNRTYDIPEQCFILAIDPSDEFDEFYMSIDIPFVWNEIIEHLLTYKDDSGKIQPIMVW